MGHNPGHNPFQKYSESQLSTFNFQTLARQENVGNDSEDVEKMSGVFLGTSTSARKEISPQGQQLISQNSHPQDLHRHAAAIDAAFREIGGMAPSVDVKDGTRVDERFQQFLQEYRDARKTHRKFYMILRDTMAYLADDALTTSLALDYISWVKFKQDDVHDAGDKLEVDRVTNRCRTGRCLKHRLTRTLLITDQSCIECSCISRECITLTFEI